MTDETVHLSDVEGALALFCEGIAGRRIHIKPIGELVSRRLDPGEDDIVQAPDAIYLPETLDAQDSSAYRVLALEQIGYRECATFSFSLEVLRQRFEVPGLDAAPPQHDSGSDLGQFFALFDSPDLARRVFRVIEQARVFAHLFRTYPGLRAHALRYFSHRWRTAALEAVDLFLCASTHAVGATSAVPALPPRFAAALELIRCSNRDVHDTAAATFDAYGELAELIGSDTHASAAALVEPDDNIFNAELKIESASPLLETEEWMGLAVEVEELKKSFDDLSSMTFSAELAVDAELAGHSGPFDEGGLRPESLTLSKLEEERGDLRRKLSRLRSSLTSALGADRSHTRSFRYDEWDYINRRYLRHWCRLYEETLGAANTVGSIGESPDSDGTPVDSLLRVMRAWRPAVQAELERIRPLGWRRVSRLTDGDELDVDAIITARADIRARRQPDERVYSRREQTHRDVCAAFLIDLSASTGDPLETPEPTESSLGTEVVQDVLYSGRDWTDWEDEAWALDNEDQEPKRKVIDVQRESIAVISAALHELGDQFGIYGFSGYGRDCVEVFVVKEPRTPFSFNTVRALASIKPKRSTRMGPAIRHTVTKLLSAATALKVLIVVSDGFPQDADYGPNRGEHEYGVQDTAKALQEAEAKGVETFCITVDRSGHDYLRKMSREGRYMVIEDIEDLPGELSKIYGTLTAR